MAKVITPESQRKIIEKLSRSNDSLTSTSRFNEKHASEIGKMGDRSLDPREFARRMKESGMKSQEIEKATKQITGHDIDLESL